MDTCVWFQDLLQGFSEEVSWLPCLTPNGSMVESLFSQYKYNAGGKLDACNYITARCAHLVQQTASSYHSGVSYHDDMLSSICSCLYKKKRYMLVPSNIFIFLYVL